MRKSLGILLAVVMLFGAGYWYHTVLAGCDVPISYRIGSVDARFNLSQDELRTAISDAESLWEDGTDRNLFTYDPEGELVINLVYDERQERANEAATLLETLDAKEGQNDQVHADYTRLVQEYETLKGAYEREARAYESALSAYNAEVADWNERGGAPKDVYDRLNATHASLARDEVSLNARAKKLNALAERINTVGAQGNTLAKRYNALVEEYNERFGDGGEFTQGDYTDGTISVYEFTSRDELVIVLAHELGHALGIDHVAGEDSIMYMRMGGQSHEAGITATDREAFIARCGTADNTFAAMLSALEEVLLRMRAQVAG